MCFSLLQSWCWFPCATESQALVADDVPIKPEAGSIGVSASRDVTSMMHAPFCAMVLRQHVTVGFKGVLASFLAYKWMRFGGW